MSYLWHDSFLCVTWLILIHLSTLVAPADMDLQVPHKCHECEILIDNMAHYHSWHALILIYLSDPADMGVLQRKKKCVLQRKKMSGGFVCWYWDLRTCWNRDWYIYVTCLIHFCDWFQFYNDSFTHMWVIHVWAGFIVCVTTNLYTWQVLVQKVEEVGMAHMKWKSHFTHVHASCHTYKCVRCWRK